MALDFRSASEQLNLTANAECTVVAPSGIIDDDILIFVLERAVVTSAISWPTGFVELWGSSGNHDGGNFAGAWKRASSESGNYQATWSGNSLNVGIVYAISGALISADPITIGTVATGAGVTPDPPNADPGSSEDRLAIACYGQEGKGDNRFAEPSGYTEPANSDVGTTGSGSGAGHCGLGLSYKLYTGQAENPGTTTSSINDGWAAQTIIFDEEPSADTTDQEQAAMQQIIIPTLPQIVPVSYF